MDNISIAIVSDDAEYNRALSRSLISVSRDLSVTSFGSMQFVSNWNAHRGRKPYYETFDIVLWAGEEIRDAYGDNIIFLTDRESDEEIDYTVNRFSIYKYRSGRSIAKVIFDIYSHLFGGRVLKMKDKDLRIVAFASSGGGSGCTTVAMAAARELCRFRSRRVLYLSLEDVESTEDYFTEPNDKGTVGEYLYRLLGDRTSLIGDREGMPFLEGFLIKDKFGLETFRPTGAGNPLRELPEAEMDCFLGAVTGCGRFDTIIIDMGSCITGAGIRAMEESDSICIVSQPGSSRTRMGKYKGRLAGITDFEAKTVEVVNMWEGSGSGENANSIFIRRVTGETGRNGEILMEGILQKDVEGLVDLLLAR
ncbi:MAG: hypothetical protein ACI4KL_06075 [Lentihominibacter sp.]